MRFKLSEQERKEIKELHGSSKDRRSADKLKSLLLLDNGYSCMKVAKILLLDDDTIRTYRDQYISEGVEDLLSTNFQGRKTRLSISQMEELDAHLNDTVYPDSKSIINWVAQKYGLLYKPTGIIALLNRLGYVYKKPKLVPCKANKEKQEAFVSTYEKLKETLATNDQIYFLDGVHPQHNSKPGYGWIKRKQTKYLPSNNGRARININGALNIATKEVTVVEGERINAQNTIELLQKLKAKQNRGKIHIILDNARYYHCKLVKRFAEENKRIKLHFLPPYSPNLNIIERLWLILKKKIVYNKFYLKFDDFKTAVRNFFTQQDWMDQKLLADKFHIINPDFSGSFL